MPVIAIAARNRIWILLIAAIVDLSVGDPPGLWHPVQGIGALISRTESGLRRLFKIPVGKEKLSHNINNINNADNARSAQDTQDTQDNQDTQNTQHTQNTQNTQSTQNAQDTQDIQNAQDTQNARESRERAAGGVLVLLVLIASTGLVLLLLALCRRINPWLGIIAEGILCGRLLALRSLREAAYAVRDPLLQGDVDGARRAVSMIVGRDTDPLNAEGIAKAAVETVAENTSDGVTAPLFYMILFGGIGGIFYKAVNTMDSMIGYKNDRYRFFGTAAARLDDVMNYIPSRLSALLMILTCAVPFKGISNPQSPKGIFQSKSRGRLKEESPDSQQGESQDKVRKELPDMRAAFRIWRRDRRKSPSPNSAQTESVCAGALHLRLLGDTWYFGKLHHKAEIGDGDRTVEPHDITRAVSLMVRTSLLLYVIGTAVLLALIKLLCWP
ncbi:cobalamin biosynthesis protein CobD [Sarcina sp. DSM 11001]|uniref:adenosylcobinamide-phosphate synthase CbiB n=1 Tax=Sarcina sp. DSM 11001 TaxID=1798184 RepID=UPI000889AAA0|nr:adenosylcobinamide-phosphate synthase CbiB [Sarcina sp. DSM 11001]SDL30574.1 cobalamin biosynthesis protein CobD [Sarcina sp. DSM 11001]